MDDKEQWLHNKLGNSQVSTIIMGQSPSSSAYNEEGIGIPFLQGCAEFGEVFPNTTVFSTDLLKIAPENSILMSVRAPVGTINKADQKYVIGRGVCSIVPVIDGDFLYYYLLQNTHELELKAQGSTFLAINSSELNEMPISFPASLPAQRRIAAILSSADKVIASTQKVIAKYKQMKQGMMEDLLKPREGWKMVKLGEIIVDSYAGGTPNRGRGDYFGGDIPWVSSGEVNNPEINSTFENITIEGLNNSSAKWIPENSILVALYGATAGQVSMLRIRATSNQAVLAIIPNDEVADTMFLYYQIVYNKENLLFLAQGSGQPNLSKNLVDKLEISIPDLTEQQRIASILSGIDAKIAAEEKVLEKYEKVKKGMMEKLLSSN